MDDYAAKRRATIGAGVVFFLIVAGVVLVTWVVIAYMEHRRDQVIEYAQTAARLMLEEDPDVVQALFGEATVSRTGQTLRVWGVADVTAHDGQMRRVQYAVEVVNVQGQLEVLNIQLSDAYPYHIRMRTPRAGQDLQMP